MSKEIDISRINKYPVLKLGNKVGMTSYIDFIRSHEVKFPVMYGRDVYGRHFIVVKMIINNRKIMQTFFQRYTNGELWMGCGHATSPLISTEGGMDSDQIQLLYDIIEDKKPKLYAKHRPYNYNECREIVYLNNEKQIKAANIIKKQWIKCRYDPSYKMCETVLLNNIKEIHDKYDKSNE